jgi:hypothetical protein
MLSKRHVVDSIAAIGKQLGRAPSLLEFVGRARMPRNSVMRFFPRWNDAVRAAGLQPRRLYTRPQDDELLKDWGEVARKTGELPSRRGYRLVGKYEARTLERRFGAWEYVPRAFRLFAKGKREWADVLALLPAPGRSSHGHPFAGSGQAGCPVPRQHLEGCVSAIPPRQLHPRLRDRATYGNSTNFLGLRYEPVNEQGVVLLFGMLARDLGYMIEAVQKRFPDCEAMRQVAPERWQRVHIEFELRARITATTAIL